jgi:hypothetical protein
MSQINKFTLHALLLDSILHYKNGMHLTRNYTTAKRMYCSAVGISPRTTSKKMIEHIGFTYIQNGMEEKFNDTCAKFGLQVN